MANPTRYPNGISTASDTNGPLGDYPAQDPTKTHTYFEDFDYYAAADWTVTEAGSATQVLANEDGGVLLITNAAADDNSSFQQKVGESYLFESGKKTWFKSRFKVSDATESDFVMGLMITDTTPLGASDAVYFIKFDSSTSMDIRVAKDGTLTTTSGVATIVDDTYIEASFFYDGKDSIKVFIDDVQVATSVTTNLPDDEELRVTFGVQNGEAVAKTMSVDYIPCCQGAIVMRPVSEALSSQAISDPIVVNMEQADFKLGLFVALSSGASLTYSVQHTGDSPVDFSSNSDYNTNATWHDTLGLTGNTATDDGNIIVPVRAVRLNVTSYTSGSATITVLQGS